MSNTHEEPVMASASSSLGDQLRQAREAKKYTVSEVAAQLRLTKDVVDSLENQDWDKLNGRTYARGYFASYVKFLGLPYEEMLAVFNLEYTATEPSLNLRQHTQGSDDKAFPWFMLALIAIVALVLWLAYQQWQNSQAMQQAAVAEQQSSENPDDTFADSIVEPMQTLPETGSTQSASEAADDQAGMSDTLTISDESLSEINATEQLAGGDLATVQNEDKVVEQPADLASTLRLSFNGECWVEVTNDADRVLVSKVMQAKDSLELSSEQPLHVLLGRADAATVIFNDKQVDLKPYTQGDVARLTLGVES